MSTHDGQQGDSPTPCQASTPDRAAGPEQGPARGRADDGGVSLTDDRRRHYADGALVLREGHRIPGAEGLFNQALTNGLLALAEAAGIPDAHKPYPPAARALIALLTGKSGPDERPPAELLARLLGAVERTDPARHGRLGARQLTDDDVHDLVDLDAYDGLGVLDDAVVDRDAVRATAADHDESARAGGYLQLLEEHLGVEEIERRIALAQGLGGPGVDGEGHDPQECPVCMNETLVVHSLDDFAVLGAGTCTVCSYERSTDVLHWDAIDAALARHADD